MSANETDVHNAIRVVDLHYQPVVISLDVEDHAIPSHDARAGVLLLKSRGRVPILLLNFPKPRQKRFLRVRMYLPELPKSLLGDDSHK